jgi:hypothetical protein
MLPNGVNRFMTRFKNDFARLLQPWQKSAVAFKARMNQ